MIYQAQLDGQDGIGVDSAWNDNWVHVWVVGLSRKNLEQLKTCEQTKHELL